jgi:hypothetical protein
MADRRQQRQRRGGADGEAGEEGSGNAHGRQLHGSGLFAYFP